MNEKFIKKLSKFSKVVRIACYPIAVKRISSHYLEIEKRMLTLQCVTGNKDNSAQLMKKCNEIGTHFTTPNRIVEKECYDIVYKLALTGWTQRELLIALCNYDNNRLKLIRSWNLSFKQEHYGFDPINYFCEYITKLKEIR
jgi:hypothetical protein